EPELIRKILDTDPPPLGVGGPQLARIVARAVEKSPELRYASAREMQTDLLEAADALAGAEEDTLREPVVPVFHIRLEPPRLHNLPFAPLGDLLKGRSAELYALARALAEDRSSALVLHGLGGIGKTRLAVEYAWRFGRRYPAVLFVLADSPNGLNSGLAALARTDLLDLPERNLPAETEVIGAVVRWLRENPGWLLILDNVDTKEARLTVTKLLPALTAGRVLITSRRRDWPAGVRRQALDRVLLQPAAEFLLERTREDRKREADDVEQAFRLSELLDGLPLALEQAGAYIAYTQISLAEYLAEWERERAAVLGWHDEGAMQYPTSLGVTWKRSFQQLSPTAQAILRLASFLAPDPIPLEMFDLEEIVHQAASLLSDETGQRAAPGKVRDEIAELRSLSLISGQGRLFSLHRLMQEVIRDQIPADRRAAWNDLVLQLLRLFSPFEAQDPSTWPVWDYLRPHAFQALAHADELGSTGSFAMFFVSNLLGVFLFGKGLYAEAEPLMRRALELSEPLFGTHSIAAAAQLTNLGVVLKTTGRLREAEPLFRKAVEIFESNPGALPSPKEAEFLRPGERLPEKTLPFHGLAFALMEKQQYGEAEGLLQKALTLALEAGDQPSVAATLHTLALLLRTTGRTDEAELTIRRSLEISTRVHGAAHPRT
ncbi:MAG: tetratricopeptide repeat protein, partial [Thermoanaerobaculia bacterium]